MAYRVRNTLSKDFVINRPCNSRPYASACCLSRTPGSNNIHHGTDFQHLRKAYNPSKLYCHDESQWGMYGKEATVSTSQRFIVCNAMPVRGTEKEERTISSDCVPELLSVKIREDESSIFQEHESDSKQGLAEACKYVCNDAKYVNERARSDFVLLSRGIMSLDARARRDVAILGSGFLRLDARARRDTEMVDRDMKAKAERLQHIANIFKDNARYKLKDAADKHWSDGALEADLQRADIHAKQRAMQDAFMALEFVKNIHVLMVNEMYKLRQRGSSDGIMDLTNLKLQKNGRATESFPGIISSERIAAIQEAYWSMASAFSEADGIDYSDPEELELLIRTLIDLDAMDGKSSVSLLAECSCSPDISTRQALANALAAAPSMWTLGNAGMGALQRLAEDNNLAISTAASKAIYELRKQWEIEEGDSWTFTIDKNVTLTDFQVDQDDSCAR